MPPQPDNTKPIPAGVDWFCPAQHLCNRFPNLILSKRRGER